MSSSPDFRPNSINAQLAVANASGLAKDYEKLFRQLVNDHQAQLHRFIIRHIGHPDDAADLTQQAFAEAARTIATFRGESQLSTWLFGIAMNMVRNYLNRAPHRVHTFESDEVLAGVAAGTPEPEEEYAQREEVRLVNDALAELPEEMREVLLLVAVDELSYEEAAAMLSIPIGTVRSRISRARTSIRQKLAKRGVTLSCDTAE